MPVIWTLEEKCRRCYSCIRECPAKAIKVEHGQAKVIENRCLGCGHCVRVCSQGAKAVLDGVQNVLNFLAGDRPVAAMVAPSFVAAYSDWPVQKFVGALRACGFDYVVETAFGADLINRAYFKLVHNADGLGVSAKKPIIASSCPALTNYIEKYAPELIQNLAPIVSPMVAMGRVVRKYYSEQVLRVFIGPCTAKKVEIMTEEVRDAVDEVLTFAELEQIWQLQGVSLSEVEPAEFDPPRAYLGRVYPLAGGFLRSAGLPADVMSTETLVTEGKAQVLNLIESLRREEVPATIIDVLFCEGCINGPFMNQAVNYFNRKHRLVSYAEESRLSFDYTAWRRAIEECQDVPIFRSFHPDVVPVGEPSEADIKAILARIDKFAPADELNCGACGYESCRAYAKAVYQGLAEPDMCLPYLIDKMQRMQEQLQQSMNELAETQQQLLQHEKLASIGQLAAGVAHEVNNPLGAIMLYAHLVKQRLGENDPNVEDIKFIMEEARRCQSIVSGLLNFSRQGRLNLTLQHIGNVIQRTVKAVRRQPLFSRVDIRTIIKPDVPSCYMDAEQMHQVFLNLAVNAAEAMPEGGTLTITAQVENDKLQILFEDTGVGIPKENLGKLFTPFFTTKQIGKGTGLGLAIAYGIVKMHKGNIMVKHSEVGKGTTFLVELPLVTEQAAIESNGRLIQ